MESKKKKGRLIWFLLSFAFVVVTILWWNVTRFYQDYRNIPPHHLVGNRASTVAALKEEGFPFSFLVIGDPTGRGTAETLMKTAFEKGNASFMVILGDFVRSPDIWQHRFFLTEMAVKIKPPFPVFLVPGNHDIDYRSKIESRDRKVTPEVYESLYGAKNFDLIFNQCLFIISEIDPRNPLGYLTDLRQSLTEKGEGKKHIFVFMHIPPKGLAPYIKTSHPEEEAFFSLLEKHKRVTCFFGHYHGYRRSERKGVNYIVTGGGGRLKRGQPVWGKFNHLLRVTVEQDKNVEEMITIQDQFGLENRVEEKVFTIFFPIIQNFFWILYLILVALLVGSGYSVLKLIRAGR